MMSIHGSIAQDISVSPAANEVYYTAPLSLGASYNYRGYCCCCSRLGEFPLHSCMLHVPLGNVLLIWTCWAQDCIGTMHRSHPSHRMWHYCHLKYIENKSMDQQKGVILYPSKSSSHIDTSAFVKGLNLCGAICLRFS